MRGITMDTPRIEDPIQAELEKAKLRAKQERRNSIGNLLDKATGVLSDILDSTEPKSANQRLRAAEVAVNLYIQQESGERQDRTLELQERRLDIETAKLSLPGQPLFQQNNLIVNGQQSAGQQAPEDAERARAELYARKKAQAALLETFLPPDIKKENQQIIDVDAVQISEETNSETTE